MIVLLTTTTPPGRPDMSDRDELATKVFQLVDVRFAGDYRAAFNHYAGEDDRISREELAAVLRDAGIGNLVTRQGWVRGVMAALDADRDGSLTWDEFETAVKG